MTEISAELQARIDEAVERVLGLVAGNPPTLDGIRAIVQEFSAAAHGEDGVLYSGRLSDNKTEAGAVAPDIARQLGWSCIDETDRAKLLLSDDFQEAVSEHIADAWGLSDDDVDREFNKVFYYSGPDEAIDGDRSFFSQASIEFSASLSGRVLVIGDMPPLGVCARDEIPTICANAEGGEVNGIQRPELAEASPDDAVAMIRQESLHIIGTDGITKVYETYGLSQEAAARLQATMPDIVIKGAFPFAEAPGFVAAQDAQAAIPPDPLAQAVSPESHEERRADEEERKKEEAAKEAEEESKAEKAAATQSSDLAAEQLAQASREAEEQKQAEEAQKQEEERRREEEKKEEEEKRVAAEEEQRRQEEKEEREEETEEEQTESEEAKKREDEKKEEEERVQAQAEISPDEPPLPVELPPEPTDAEKEALADAGPPVTEPEQLPDPMVPPAEESEPIPLEAGPLPSETEPPPPEETQPTPPEVEPLLSETEPPPPEETQPTPLEVEPLPSETAAEEIQPTTGAELAAAEPTEPIAEDQPAEAIPHSSEPATAMEEAPTADIPEELYELDGAPEQSATNAVAGDDPLIDSVPGDELVENPPEPLAQLDAAPVSGDDLVESLPEPVPEVDTAPVPGDDLVESPPEPVPEVYAAPVAGDDLVENPPEPLAELNAAPVPDDAVDSSRPEPEPEPPPPPPPPPPEAAPGM